MPRLASCRQLLFLPAASNSTTASNLPRLPCCHQHDLCQQMSLLPKASNLLRSSSFQHVSISADVSPADVYIWNTVPAITHSIIGIGAHTLLAVSPGIAPGTPLADSLHCKGRLKISPASTSSGVMDFWRFQDQPVSEMLKSIRERLLHTCGGWPEPNSVLMM